MSKVYIYSLHPESKFGKERMDKILEIHGKNSKVVFERMPVIEGTAQFVLMRHMFLINEKSEAGYICYLEIDKKLARKLLAKGLSFGVIDKPVKVSSGKRITFTYYNSEKPLEFSEHMVATTICKAMPESGGFINRTGRKSGYKKTPTKHTTKRTK